MKAKVFTRLERLRFNEAELFQFNDFIGFSVANCLFSFNVTIIHKMSPVCTLYSGFECYRLLYARLV